MLLPSDVARLVLGYLQEEGLTATSQAFIHESPNLKEYAEHTTGDGTIPACVFSVFGKSLTTILNEYVAVKAKETCPEVPVVMTSLWKKLDFTLNQIKSLQNSPAISASQRLRSQIGVANMARQRVLTLASASSVICSTVSETSSIISPAHTSHSMLGHSTPVSYTGPQTRPAPSSVAQQQVHDSSRLLNTPRDSPVHVIMSENRLNPGPMSPGRRKWDTPRKRSGAISGSSGPGRSVTTVSSISTETETEEAVDENFPQLVIQNARDKILGDRSLQEKLAENINKILANEPTPQASKVSSSTMEADQSIDEILGLQGEIHMSDDAIHDILEQTESDPAFQALFDLFDYNKTRFTDEEPGDGEISSSPEETDTAGPSPTVRPVQSEDPGDSHTDTNTSDTAPVTMKMKPGQERKTRKSTATTLSKKTVRGRASRIENCSARLIVSQGDPRSVSSAAVDSKRRAAVTPMDVDEPLNTPSTPLALQESATKNSATASTTVSPLTNFIALSASTSRVDKKREHKQAQGSKEHPQPVPAANLPIMSVPNCTENTVPVSLSVMSESMSTTHASACVAVTTALSSSPTAAPFTVTLGTPTSASTSATLTATPASSTPASPSCYSSALVAASPDLLTANPSTPNKAAADNIMSLKIIISDNQEDNTSSDTALNQAISSISGDNIPTIYLSSPAKSPGVPGTPKANMDEAAQAVSGLQNSEVHTSPLSGKPGAVITSPLTGTSQAQQSYIIQLPLDTTNPALQAAAPSFFLVTEPTATDVQTRQVLLPAGISKGPPLVPNQYGITAPSPSQGFSAGPSLILPSPGKPMMLPVSVVGQNPLGKVQMVSNQLVAIPNPVAVQQTETVKPKASSVTTKKPAVTGTEKNLVGKVVQPVSTENPGQQDAVKGPSHKRILCFESSAEVKPQSSKTRTTTPSAPNTSVSQSVTRTRPTILGGNKPKRRVDTVRGSADPQSAVGSVKESTPSQQHHRDFVRKSSRKQHYNIHNLKSQSVSTSVDVSQAEGVKNSESGRRSKSGDKKHNQDTVNKEPKSSKSSDSALKLESRKEKEESSQKDPSEKVPLKSCEILTEKRTPSQEMPNVTANKENEMKGITQEPQSTPSSSVSRDFSPPPGSQQTANTQSKVAKAPSKTSSLAKQAAEMLQNIQGQNSPSTRSGAGSSDISLPSTGCNQDALLDSPRTPSRMKKVKDVEGTPKHLMPPNTPDVPTCSPASETGSENSINMAAHTLMILSRAAIARTGTPLKDSLRQDGVGEKMATSSKNSKKRKQASPTASPPAKETKRSPGKKKDREWKKLVDCFPHDLDVDKFLSSLHYDE
ncbi:protein NPAT [Parambassis ranga]|uniref:Protein NPAT n=1 Tax=Parambassis ranga TaxID=210632 RepID=A0A6P7JL34_9TELE|nr:protein NPAT [Parambassis ranga]